jgi:hypothetical protein
MNIDKEDILINQNPELDEKEVNKMITKINKIKPIIPQKIGLRDLFKFYKTVSPPLFKRSRFNERFEIYKTITSYLSKEKILSNNCLEIPKISDIKYIIDKNIILEKQIGSPSVVGTIFLSHYKNDVNNKFATKFADPFFLTNINEYKVLKKLTDIVLTEKIPHFPLTYGHLLCYNDYNSKRDYKNRLIITYNELANGDYKMFYKKFYDNDKLILNAFTQIFISIMFFEYYLSMFHNDAHHGNFLYHKIDEGGYFYYKIYDVDYYIKNEGYVWLIWDFGLVKKFEKNNDATIIRDYRRIINAFMNIPDNSVKIKDFFLNINNDDIIKQFYNIFIGYGWISNKYPYSDKINFIIKDFLHLLEEARNITDLSAIPLFNKLLLEMMIKHNLITTKRPNNDEIINLSPYIIEND